MDFPRGSVAWTVLIKPKPMSRMIQPTHICGQYRLVASIDSPVTRAAGARVEKLSA